MFQLEKISISVPLYSLAAHYDYCPVSTAITSYREEQLHRLLQQLPSGILVVTITFEIHHTIHRHWSRMERPVHLRWRALDAILARFTNLHTVKITLQNQYTWYKTLFWDDYSTNMLKQAMRSFFLFECTLHHQKIDTTSSNYSRVFAAKNNMLMMKK